MIDLVPLSPQEVRDRWDWVESGLLEVKGRCTTRWIPADLYVALQTGKASLYLFHVDSYAKGFLVLTKQSEPHGNVLFIWAMWCEPRTLLDNRTEFLDKLDALAKSIDAKVIRQMSSREGYDFAGCFDLAGHVYEREV